MDWCDDQVEGAGNGSNSGDVGDDGGKSNAENAENENLGVIAGHKLLDEIAMTLEHQHDDNHLTKQRMVCKGKQTSKPASKSPKETPNTPRILRRRSQGCFKAKAASVEESEYVGLNWRDSWSNISSILVGR